MKILIDASGIINKTTGVGQYSLQLLKALAEIDNKNEYSIVLQKELDESHSVYRLGKNKNFSFIQGNVSAVGPQKQRYYYSLLRRDSFKFDLLHSLNSELPLYCDVKKVVTIHDLKYLKYPHFFKDFSRIKAKYLEYIMKKGVEKANKIIAVSQSTKKDIINILGIDKDKIRVIYEASNLVMYSQQNNNMSNEKIIEKYAIKKPYFLYVGEKRPHKNIEGLIEAFAIFKEKYDQWDTSLVIAGKQYSGYQDYIKKAEKLGVIDLLIFTGFIPNEHLKPIYTQAEALLFVSFYEGFGIPILEAMECGIPVITSNISSMSEVAGDAALLVDPGNIQKIAFEMNELMKSDSLKKQMIEKGLKRNRQFSWKSTARETLQVYEEIYKKY